jgi:heavy metal sensor kinase
MAPVSVRARLTLWHAGVLTLIVCVFAVGSLLFVRARLYADLDARLGQELSTIDRVYREEPNELGDLPTDRGFLFFQITERATLRHQSDGWKQMAFLGASREPASWKAADGSWFRVQALSEEGYRIAAAVEETALRHIVSTFGLILLLGIPFAAALAIVGGYFLAGRVLAPVGAMADKAQRITAESLAERLPVVNPRDEFGRLGTVFNDMLSRVQNSFESLRRFTADASHELRTPLTAMRSVGEVALQTERDPARYRDVIGSMLEEVDRLTGLVDNLLTLTRADAGKIAVDKAVGDLREVAQSTANQLRLLAEEKQQSLALEPGGAIMASFDPRILRLALANLIHNAIKYTPTGGSVRLRVQARSNGDAIVEVDDNGPGIPASHRERVFERFYRIDSGRASDAGGAGLGLAIARWAVEANGGRMELENALPSGSVFRIVLPMKG